MGTQLKRRTAFTLSTHEFALAWLRSWAVGYVIVTPPVLLIRFATANASRSSGSLSRSYGEGN